MKQITSIQNPYVKSLVLLQEKAKARKQSCTFCHILKMQL
jgi:TrmH family RNA methyltransferase